MLDLFTSISADKHTGKKMEDYLLVSKVFLFRSVILRQGLTTDVLENKTFTLSLLFIIKIMHTLPNTELHCPQHAEIGRSVGPCPETSLSELLITRSEHML